MRARLALYVSGTTVELREVSLRNKPESMLMASPKGSVPVLVLPDGSVIDESWDIMLWALRQHDPDNWLGAEETHLEAATMLLQQNDSNFKQSLDRYKYFERYPQYPQSFYREQGELFLRQLEARLRVTDYLLGNTLSLADTAIFPFVRQFAEVDKCGWLAHSPYYGLKRWLEFFMHSAAFAAIMEKHPVWRMGDTPVLMAVRG